MAFVRIGLIGDFRPEVSAHLAIPAALRLAAMAARADVEIDWIPTGILARGTARRLSSYHALWCAPGSPYASMQGAIRAIRFARESGLPFLGTCGGFQHALLEYARNVRGLRRAGHAETNARAAVPLIAPLACSLVEKRGRIRVAAGSRLRAIYRTAEIEEEFHCRYGLNPDYEGRVAGRGMRVCGRDPGGEVRAIEIRSHPFFFATLFQPERSSARGAPHPLVAAFLRAATARRQRSDGRRPARRARKAGRKR